MIGRRGRYVTIGVLGDTYVYSRIALEPKADFLIMGLQESLFDALAFSWPTLALYHSDGFLGRVAYGAQTRIMDGVLGRANCIPSDPVEPVEVVMLPLGLELGPHLPAHHLRGALRHRSGCPIWASDALSEIAGSPWGKQKLRVWGVGEVNRKSSRDRGPLPGLARDLPLACRRERPGAALGGPGRGRLRLETPRSSLLAAGDLLLHDGELQCAPGSAFLWCTGGSQAFPFIAAEGDSEGRRWGEEEEQEDKKAEKEEGRPGRAKRTARKLAARRPHSRRRKRGRARHGRGPRRRTPTKSAARRAARGRPARKARREPESLPPPLGRAELQLSERPERGLLPTTCWVHGEGALGAGGRRRTGSSSVAGSVEASGSPRMTGRRAATA